MFLCSFFESVNGVLRPRHRAFSTVYDLYKIQIDKVIVGEETYLWFLEMSCRIARLVLLQGAMVCSRRND